jgi:hypothetical protein
MTAAWFRGVERGHRNRIRGKRVAAGQKGQQRRKVKSGRRTSCLHVGTFSPFAILLL